MLKIHTILLFFLASCNKLPGIWQLKTTENISLTFLDARNPKTIARPNQFQQSCALRETATCFSAYAYCQHSWAYDSVTPVSAFGHVALPFIVCQIFLCFSSYSDIYGYIQGICGFSRIVPSSQDPWLNCSCILVTVPRIKMSILWGHSSAFQTINYKATAKMTEMFSL